MLDEINILIIINYMISATKIKRINIEKKSFQQTALFFKQTAILYFIFYFVMSIFCRNFATKITTPEF